MYEKPCGNFSENYDKDFNIINTKGQWASLIGAVLMALILPQILAHSRATLMFINIVAIWIIALHGLNILIGYCGQISIGHAAFMAIGAYTSAILCEKVGLSFWIALPCAGVMTALVGLLFGLPSVKIKGFYLAMSTLAAQFIITFVIKFWSSLTGGTDGLPVPAPVLFGLEFDTPFRFAYISIPTCFIMTFFAVNIGRSATGKAFISVRDNDLAAEVMGVNLFLTKLKAFVIASFFVGIAGSLYAHVMTYISMDSFSLDESIWFLGMLIIGGMGHVTGPFFGAIFLLSLGEFAKLYLATYLSSIIPTLASSMTASMALIVYALAIILFLIFEPRGINHRWEILKNYYRLWPFRY